MTKTEGTGKKKKQLGYRRAWVMTHLLLTVSSFVVASVSLLCCSLAVAEDFYGTGTVQEAVMKLVGYDQCLDAADVLRDYILHQDTEGALQYFAKKNLDVALMYDYAAPPGEERSRDIIFGTYDGSYPATLTYECTVMFYKRIDLTLENNQKRFIYPERTYNVRVYVNPLFPHEDNMHLFYNVFTLVYEMRYSLAWTAMAGGMGTVLGFVLLMYSAGGYRDGATSTQTEKKQGIYWDVLLVVFLLGLLGILHWAENSFSALPDEELLRKARLVTFTGMGVIIWITVFCYNIVYQIRFGKGLSHTLIHALIQWIKSFVRTSILVIKRIPLVSTTVVTYLIICVLEFFGAAFFFDGKTDILWLLDKLILLPVVIYVALCCKRLLLAGEALAEGQLNHTVNTEGMIGEIKAHGNHLNSIGLGIARAVEERTKSERLKTELITNISHDLKTPLTSIINYSDLICQEQTENENITEYSQVLMRQSGRLKKLLEDLVEASKAVTGNLEINLAPCEVGVILSQAVGEYQRRLEEKGLELHITQPEQPVQIMADGKQLWRVFDNLLNNICKYAQESSRVYLSVERQEEQVMIIFRNMSKYALNVSAEELEERFVRGDRSRHMEGNGLGLSIAKSLLELQGAGMQIVIDGDLFKVILSFQVLEEK